MTFCCLKTFVCVKVLDCFECDHRLIPFAKQLCVFVCFVYSENILTFCCLKVLAVSKYLIVVLNLTTEYEFDILNLTIAVNHVSDTSQLCLSRGVMCFNSSDSRA